ncbi:MAG: tetratricopeptide repeat protein, partial [bacterium]
LAKRIRQLGINWIVFQEDGVRSLLDTPSQFADIPPKWPIWKTYLREHVDIEYQTNGIAIGRVRSTRPPRALPYLPMYETLAFEIPDKQLALGNASAALSAYVNPPPLLADVGSTFYRQGRAYQSLGDLEEAEHAFRDALRHGFDTPRLQLALAQILERQGRPEEGLNHARAAWLRDPDSGPPAVYLASLCRRLGRTKEEQEVFRANERRRRGLEP